MAEYIEREAAINCCFAITTIIKCGISESDAKRILEAFNEIPSADVRPVVYCKDCKYFSEVMYKGQFEYGYCDRWADGTLMNPEDFCSRAAKREET